MRTYCHPAASFTTIVLLLFFFAPAAHAQPTFSIDDPSVVEGNSGFRNLIFTVDLTIPPGSEDSMFTVDYRTFEGLGTATENVDYMPVMGTLNFPGDMSSSMQIDVPIISDTTAFEGNETVVILLENPSGAATFGDPVGEGTILEDDGMPSVSVNDVSMAEGDGGTTLFIFTITLTNADTTSDPPEVDVSIDDGTATVADNDYETIPDGTIMFDMSSTTQMRAVVIEVNGDDKAEPDETFFVRLSNISNAILVDAEGRGTIVNDDPLPQISVDDVSVLEGNSGTEQAVFTVSLSRPSAPNVQVNYATGNGTATAPADFQSTSGTLTFTEGQLMRTFAVPINGDTVAEPDETFSVTLSSPTNGALADPNGVGTILNDDAAPLPTLSVNDVSVAENAGPANFVISLSEPAPGPITVQATTANGSATVADGDFTPRDMQVAFAQGEQTKPFPVTINNDTNVEPDETFTLNLSSPTGATIADGQGVGTIVNDDVGALPQITIGDTALMEGNSGQQLAGVVLTLSATSTQTVTVNYATTDGTATAGADYAQTSDQASFAPGATTTTVMVPVFGDTVVEPDETFFVDLSSPGNATLAADRRGQVTIRNDDVVLPTLTVDDVTVIEGNAGTVDAVFTVTLSALPSNGTARVDFNTSDDSATVADGDYTPQSGTLTFDGGLQQTITVTVFGDTRDEGHERFFLQLSNPVNATIEDGEGEGRIRNDDSTGPLSFAVSDVQVTEGDTGTTAQAIFQISLSSTSGTAVSVSYATADGTATVGDNDYQAVSAIANFAPGETLVEVPVLVIGDDTIETDESFTMSLSAPQGAAISDGTGTATIVNDDVETLPSLSISDMVVVEGNAGTTTTALLTVSLSEISDTEVRTSYTTEDGTAQAADSDYASASGDLVFAPGQTSQMVTVEVIGDDRAEPQENFTVRLLSPVNAILGDGVGIVTIQNDDQDAPLPTISIGDASVTEGDSGPIDATFIVRLNIPAPAAVAVDFTTADGTASAASGDYVATNGRLTIAAGQSRGAVRVPVNGDDLVEGNETFTVQLSAPTGGILVDGSGTGTIVNDDVQVVLSEVHLVRAPATVESAGRAAVTVERVGDATTSASVVLIPADGTATAGRDYQAAPTTVRWAAGELGEKTVPITLLDDPRREADETILFSLGQPVNATLGPPAQLTLVILDDDNPMVLEAEGEETRTVRVEEAVDLAVTVRRDDGTTIAGVAVAWAVQGRGELVDGDQTLTDAQGLATNTVRFGARPGESVVTATLPGTAASVQFTITVEGALMDMIDPEEEPEDAAVAEVLDDSCSGAEGEFDELCGYVFELEDENEQMQVIDEIVPMEVSAQAGVSLETPQVQLRNIGARLSALRGGAARQGLDQLALNIRGEGLSLGGLTTAVRKYQGTEAEQVAAQLDRALGLVRGGAASGDEPAAALTEPAGQRLGFFLNGRLSVGDRPGTFREAGYDFESRGLTAGVDYRITPRFVLGGAVGYMDTETEINRDGGRLDADGYTLAAYGTFYVARFYVDGVLSYGESSYDLVRNIDLPQEFQGRRRFTARGAPDGSQAALSLGLGYDGTVGALTIGGFGRLSYVEGEIDAYTERGASAFNLRIDAQDLESLLSEVGFELGYAASFGWGVLQPTLRTSYLHEFEDDSRLIRSRFAADLQANDFLITTDTPDRDFFNVGVGLTFVLKKGRAFYLLYDTDLERADLDIYTLSAGARLQF